MLLCLLGYPSYGFLLLYFYYHILVQINSHAKRIISCMNLPSRNLYAIMTSDIRANLISGMVRVSDGKGHSWTGLENTPQHRVTIRFWA